MILTSTGRGYTDYHRLSGTTLSDTVHCSHSDHVGSVAHKTSDGGVGSGHIALVRGTIKAR